MCVFVCVHPWLCVCVTQWRQDEEGTRGEARKVCKGEKWARSPSPVKELGLCPHNKGKLLRSFKQIVK